MTTFTADQIALQQHIEAENVAWVAQCEANGSTFYTTMVSDPAHWEGYGITTIAQYERHCLVSSIWDAYKDVHGIRPRWIDFESMTIEELQKMEEGIYVEAREEFEREQRAEDLAVEAMIEAGASDRETAERWIRESE